MRIDDFDYFLPPELIAQEPADKRDSSRLMTVDRQSGAIGETGFSEATRLFRDGDILVLNDTRVIPARLIGAKESGGRVEIFLVRKLAGSKEAWQCLIRSSKPPRKGTLIRLPGDVTATVEERGDEETWSVSFTPADGFEEWLERTGRMPLPPYIKRRGTRPGEVPDGLCPGKGGGGGAHRRSTLHRRAPGGNCREGG
jgi:S-adenosylmethionine:tRNA ribosyltransferase-isomerase